MPPLVTLTTDLGDVYASQMKGMLYRRLAPGSVVDLSHDLPAHGVSESAFLLRHMAQRFPAGTVHVAVVDPGVGSPRAPLGIVTGEGSSLVGPDNGLLWPLASALGSPRSFRLDPTRIAAHGLVSPTFEGRDLFAPAAALLASGSSLEFLGSAFEPIRYEIPAPRPRADGLEGQVLHVDRFGNLITNVLTSAGAEVGTKVAVQFGRGPVRRSSFQRTYADLPEGLWAVLGSSFGYLEVSAREGSAARRFGVRVGDRVRLSWRR